MSDEPKKRARPWIWWVVLLLFALYPATYGPATLLNCVDDTGLVLKPYQIIYWPIKWVTRLLKATANREEPIPLLVD